MKAEVEPVGLTEQQVRADYQLDACVGERQLG